MVIVTMVGTYLPVICYWAVHYLQPFGGAGDFERGADFWRVADGGALVLTAI